MSDDDWYMCADPLCFKPHIAEPTVMVPGWWERLFITRAQWHEKSHRDRVKAEATGYIRAINECTVEQDIPDYSFAEKHYAWIQAGTTSSLVESLKLYMYMHSMTTRTLRDHVAWKDAHT